MDDVPGVHVFDRAQDLCCVETGTSLLKRAELNESESIEMMAAMDDMSLLRTFLMYLRISPCSASSSTKSTCAYRKSG